MPLETLTPEESSLLVAAMLEAKLQGGGEAELQAIADLAKDPEKLRGLIGESETESGTTTPQGFKIPRVKPSPFNKK